MDSYSCESEKCSPVLTKQKSTRTKIAPQRLRDHIVSFLDESPTKKPPKKKLGKKPTPHKTPRRTKYTTQKTLCRSKYTPLTSITKLEPVIVKRSIPICKDLSVIEFTKESLHVSAVPINTLPCRETEFMEVYKFIQSKILEKGSGCVYICGVPGSGKTATIAHIIKLLETQAKENEIPEFQCVKINAMQLTEPRQAYVHIYEQVMKVKITWQAALTALEKRFKTPALNRKTILLIVDEIDTLMNRREDVIYHLFEWSTKDYAKIVVVPIGNTLNFPDRLDARVRSRLGVTFVNFQPYTQRQLRTVLKARLNETNIIEDDALQLVARKVASISGDCRRALDICRRAVEISEKDCVGENVMVSMSHVQKTFGEMIANPKALCIKGCSKYEKFFLKAVEAEVTRTGVDETIFSQVYRQLESICALNGAKVPEPGIALRISNRLGASRLLICDHGIKFIHQKIMLNVTSEDLHHALFAQ